MVVVAAVVRIAAALVIQERWDGFIFLDESTYSQLAAEMATGRTEAWDSYLHGLYWETSTLLVPLTALYRLLGVHVLAGQLLVVAVGVATAGLVVALGRRFLDTWAAVFAGLVIALLPSQVLWSSLTLKDAFVWAVLSGLALLFAHSISHSGARLLLDLALALVLLVLLVNLREHTFVMACWAIVIAVVATRAPRHLVRAGSVVAIAVLLPWTSGLGPGGATFVGGQEGLAAKRATNAIGADSAVVDPVLGADGVIERAEAYERVAADLAKTARSLEGAIDRLHRTARGLEDERQTETDAARADDLAAEAARARTRARELEDDLERTNRRAADAADEADELRRLVEQGSDDDRRMLEDEFGIGDSPPGGLVANVRYLPRGLATMLLRPYPWTASASNGMRLAQAEMVLWYPILLLAGIGLLPALRRHRQVLLLAVLLGAGSLLMSTLAQGNLGTAYRHRGEFVWVVALLAATGLQAVRRARGGRQAATPRTRPSAMNQA